MAGVPLALLRSALEGVRRIPHGPLSRHDPREHQSLRRSVLRTHCGGTIASVARASSIGLCGVGVIVGSFAVLRDRVDVATLNLIGFGLASY